MELVVIAFGVLILAIGAFGAIAPSRLVRFLMEWPRETRLSVAIGVRLVLGVALLVAAPATGFPGVIYALGVIALVAGATLLVIGPERFDRFVAWWAARPSVVIRLWSIFAACFGAFLVYAVASAG